MGSPAAASSSAPTQQAPAEPGPSAPAANSRPAGLNWFKKENVKKENRPAETQVKNASLQANLIDSAPQPPSARPPVPKFGHAEATFTPLEVGQRISAQAKEASHKTSIGSGKAELKGQVGSGSLGYNVNVKTGGKALGAPEAMEMSGAELEVAPVLAELNLLKLQGKVESPEVRLGNLFGKELYGKAALEGDLRVGANADLKMRAYADKDSNALAEAEGFAGAEGNLRANLTLLTKDASGNSQELGALKLRAGYFGGIKRTAGAGVLPRTPQMLLGHGPTLRANLDTTPMTTAAMGSALGSVQSWMRGGNPASAPQPDLEMGLTPQQTPSRMPGSWPAQ